MQICCGAKCRENVINVLKGGNVLQKKKNINEMQANNANINSLLNFQENANFGCNQRLYTLAI